MITGTRGLQAHKVDTAPDFSTHIVIFNCAENIIKNNNFSKTNVIQDNAMLEPDVVEDPLLLPTHVINCQEQENSFTDRSILPITDLDEDLLLDPDFMFFSGSDNQNNENSEISFPRPFNNS